MNASDTSPLIGIHHVALIASDYARSKDFYTRLLGLRVIAENYRAARDSWKLDLALPDGSQLELFSFPGAPPRPSRPEARPQARRLGHSHHPWGDHAWLGTQLHQHP